MEKKKSFVLYHSYYDSIVKLNMTERGALLTAIFEYQINGEVSVELSSAVAMAFSFIKSQFDADYAKYQNVVQRNRKNGAKGGRPKKTKNVHFQNPTNPTNPMGFEEKISAKPDMAKADEGAGFNHQKPKKPKKADNDNDNDNDIDNDIIKRENIKREKNALALDNKCEDKKAYGEFSNVLLTEVEYSELCDRFGNKTAEMIDFFSAKLKAKGYHFENHYATIILWAKQDGKDKGESLKSYDLDDFFEAACKRTYEELENAKEEG